MKKTFLMTAVLFWMASCSHAAFDRHTSMRISDENGSINIKASGRVRFNADESAIQSISPGGYLHYSRNNRKLKADADAEGRVHYQLYDGGKWLQMDTEGKAFVSHVVHDIVSRGFETRNGE